MKIAITATGDTLDAQVDPRFGRCQKFIIYDTDKKEIIKVVDNVAAGAMGGAGIQAGQLVANEGVDAVLTGNLGPNAMATLSAAGIKTYPGFSGTVKDAIESFEKGSAPVAGGATVDAHFGTGGQAQDASTGDAGSTGQPAQPGAPPQFGFGRGGGGGMGGGRGMGRGRGWGAGPPAQCMCPSCSKLFPHMPGTPCRSMKCPDCGTILVRGD